MSNIDKAAEIIAEARRTAPRVRDMQDHISPHIAQALADAGLLAPELPERGKAWGDDDAPSIWRTDGESDTLAVVLMKDNSLQVEDFNEVFMQITPSAGRGLAAALLAAANYAEEASK